MAVRANTKNPKGGQALTKTLKSISGGRTVSFRDMSGNGLRLKVTKIQFK